MSSTEQPPTGATTLPASGGAPIGPPMGGREGAATVVTVMPTPDAPATPGSLGRTSIADSVVQKIAGIAAREVSGVFDLGGGGARAFGALRERIPGAFGPNVGQGVSVEVGERQAAVDLDVVVEYGVAIADLAQAIRRNVIASVERMTGLEVTEVNIAVNDIHLAGDDAETESRVQ